LGGILEWILECSFGSVFGVHFCTLFGQNFARDLLVLRDFFDVDGGFWAFFSRVFDRPFGHDFATFHLSRVAIRYAARACWS
jgi:hypothetical protein